MCHKHILSLCLYIYICVCVCLCVCVCVFPWWLSGKEAAHQCRRPDSILRSGRSPGEGNGSQLQYSCQENSMDRGAAWATVQGVTGNSIQLSD